MVITMDESKGILVRVEENKKELIKNIARLNGISMNEFINKAIDMALSLETKETLELAKDKEILERELISLEKSKEQYLKKYNEDKEILQRKIKQIDLTIDDMTIETEEKIEKDNYDHLVNLVYNGRRIDNISDLILDHASKYDLDVEDLKNKILEDVTARKFRR